jgi:hypothetical protein
MSSNLRELTKHILTWLLYASAGFGAVAYALFLRARQALWVLEEAHGLAAGPSASTPREVLVRKLQRVEALRGLAIVVMLVGFLFWPLLILGVLLFFFQTNAWKATQQSLFTLDRDHPEYQRAYQACLDALDVATRTQHGHVEHRSRTWQRVFAVTMAIALLFALGLLTLLLATSASSPTAG